MRGFRALCVVLVIFAIVFSAETKCFGEIIPGSRRMTWRGNVGVPGGIPNRTTIFVNVKTTTNAAYKCMGDGVTDDAAALQNALKDCPQNQVVYAPAGVYKLAGTINVWGANRKNYTLRGDGMGRTIFRGVNGVGRFLIGSGQNPCPADSTSGGLPVTTGATAGSTVLTVADASTVNVGNLVTLQMDTPTWMHKITQATEGADAWNTHFKMTFKVTAKTATTVTVTPPLPMTVTAWNPRIIPWGNGGGGVLTEGVGFEDFTIDATTGSSIPFQMSQAWGCWLKNVENKGTKSRQFYFLTTCASEVRRCYTHDTQGSGPNHEGIDFVSNACWNLVEDNICKNAGKPSIIFGDSQGGCVGNVSGYNYTQLADLSGTSQVSERSVSDSHGCGNMLNLYEGNVMKGFNADGYFGSASHGTLLRNWIHNITSNLGPIAVNLCHYSNYYNFVGNVLGSPIAPVSRYDTEATGSYLACIWRLGYPNVGNFGWSNGTEGTPNPAYENRRTVGPTTPPNYRDSPNTRGPGGASAQALDLNVKNTIIRHGNFDYATKNADGSPRTPGIVWETDDARGTGVDFDDHIIPNSYYLTAKPSWWPTTVPWPSIGPDKTPIVGVIPAQARFEALMAEAPARPVNLNASSSPSASPTPP